MSPLHVRLIAITSVLSTVGLGKGVAGFKEPVCQTDTKQDIKAEKNHVVDSLNLLIFVSLLIFTVLTIWMFKHRRFRFIHETGLAIIYGLIIGLLIRYTTKPSRAVTQSVDFAYNWSSGVDFEPPDLLKLQVSGAGNNTTTEYFQYAYQSKIDIDTFADPELESKVTFDPEVFFNVILPPIIFNAGYHMKRKHFFKNFGAIVAYAFIGTTISSFAIGGLMYGFSLLVKSTMMCFTDCLLFGTIISATDPVTVLAIFNDLNVDVDLYALVFGESVLNDAVAIVLAGSIEIYESAQGGFDGWAASKCFGNFLIVFFGSFALGSCMGCVTALLTKFTRIQDFPLLETSLFVLMSYGTFVAAEAATLSGIVAVLFCGICQAHYTYNNLSPQSQARTKEVFELLNFLLENFVFAYIGVSTFTFRNHLWDPGFISFSFIAVLVARACNIYPLSFLLNLGRKRKIAWNIQHMLMYSGLRGAMAFALAMRNTSTKAHQLILSTTLIIVIATVMLCGGFATQVLQWLKIRVGVDDETELQNFDSSQHYTQSYESISARSTSVNSYIEDALEDTAANDEVLNSVPATARISDKTGLVRVWSNMDSRFVKPMLTHVRPPLTETLPNCCLPLARLLTSTEQMTQTAGTSTARQRSGNSYSDTELVLADIDEPIDISTTAAAVGTATNTSTTESSKRRTSSLLIDAGLLPFTSDTSK